MYCILVGHIVQCWFFLLCDIFLSYILYTTDSFCFVIYSCHTYCTVLIPVGFQAEDEEGYRNLIDQKKDKRLAYLLSQTDEYISSLTMMVQQHKKEQMKKKRHKGQRRKSDFEDEVEEGRQRIPVYDTETGHVLKGEDGPTADQLEEWLASHPG